MKRLSGFSLMEMMVVLLIVAVVAAASAPMVNKKMLNAAAEKSPWVWTGLGNSIAYNINESSSQTASIGAISAPNDLFPRLYINRTDELGPHITFGFNDQNINLNLNRNNVNLTRESTSNTGTVAIGNRAITSNDRAIAIGSATTARGLNSIAIGFDTEATGGLNGAFSATAVGAGAKSHGAHSLALGFMAKTDTNANQASALGCSSTSVGSRAISLGASAEARGNSAISIGGAAVANSDHAIAIGSSHVHPRLAANALGRYSIAIGSESEALTSSVAIGTCAISDVNGSIAIGTGAEALSSTGSGAAPIDDFEIKEDSSILLSYSELVEHCPKHPTYNKDMCPFCSQDTNTSVCPLHSGFAKGSCPICDGKPAEKMCVDCGKYPCLCKKPGQIDPETEIPEICSGGCNNSYKFTEGKWHKTVFQNGLALRICEDCAADAEAYKHDKCWDDFDYINRAYLRHTTIDRDNDGWCSNCDPDENDPWNGEDPDSNVRDTALSQIPGASSGSGASIAIGCNSTAMNSGIAIGNQAEGTTGAQATGSKSIAIGSASKNIGATDATAVNSISIGTGAKSSNASTIAIGTESQSTQSTAIAIGYGAKATGTKSIAIGTASNKPQDTIASKNGTIAIGTGAKATHDLSTAIGVNATTTTTNQIVLGNESTTVYIPGRLVVDQHVYLNRVKGYNTYIRTKHGEQFGRITEGTTDLGLSEWTEAEVATISLSDRRLKDVSEVFTAGLDEIKKLEVFNYTFKKDPDKTPRVGVMAQDLQKIFPKAVFEGKDGFLRIRMEDMFYALVNAVKQLDAKIEEIKNNQIAQLLDKVAKLEEQNTKQAEINKKQEEMIEKLIKQNEEIISQNKEIVKQNKDLKKQLKKAE